MRRKEDMTRLVVAFAFDAPTVEWLEVCGYHGRIESNIFRRPPARTGRSRWELSPIL